jgi:[pyruvate, water dikinase]-phosphate phosphotransferase / [pyruvate, water dikinase] kinase
VEALVTREPAAPPPPTMPNRRTVYFISDRTGITAEMLGNSLLTQFEEIEFQRVTIPFVDGPEKVDAVIEQINETAAREGRPPIVFSSIVDEAMSQKVRRGAKALTLDLFQTFVAPLETELGVKSSHAAGRSHGIVNSHEYFARMEAINFTQTHDDGAATRDLRKAQVILVGVSRCGKTPTSLYLALQFGIRAANFPLTPDDFAERALPASVVPHRERLFGLTINPERLHRIREERRPGSRYSSLDNCRYEVRECENLLEREGIPTLDTTAKSIEEIATTISYRAKLRRHAY